MLNIINSGYLKILRLFYNERNAFHLREIAKRTNLNENSIYRFLKKLEEGDILKSKRQGNLKLFSLKQNNHTYLLLELFDIERYEQLPNIRKTAISTYLKELPQQPIFAILFGSTARGTYKEDSDIDILLITNRKIDTKKAEYEADAQSALKISTFQITYNGFLTELKLKEDKVIQSALKTGYPLINNRRFYEVLNDETI